MRYMILVKATADSEAGTLPGEDLLAAMASFHEALARAGVLLDANGLRRSGEGWRVHYDGASRRVIDGPFAETKELVAGYTIIQVRSREEAVEWSRRFPNPALDQGAAQIEVRPMFEAEDFTPGEAIDRFKALHAAQAAPAAPGAR